MKDKKVRFFYIGRPLTEEDLKQYAPSVMNEKEPWNRVTEKYAFFPTIQLIRDLRTVGWVPYGVEQRRVYDENRKDYTKHMVSFRNIDIESIDDLIPEIIITNSHDGRNSFQFFAGLFHVTKKTTFIVDEFSFIKNETELEEFRVKHQGYTLDQVKDVVNKVVTAIPLIYDNVNLMRQTILSPTQKLSFAMEAIRMRWKDKKNREGEVVKKGGKDEVDFEDLIMPIREDEHESTLWNLFQILHEKIVNGGIKYTLTKKGNVRKQTARSLVNIDQKIEVKKSLWRIASDLTNIIRQTPIMKTHEEGIT